MMIEQKLDQAAAAEFVLKAHIVITNPELAANVIEDASIVQPIAEAVDLTEAPEDALCSLIIDLMHYCKREHIDWTQDVVARALERYHTEQTGGAEH